MEARRNSRVPISNEEDDYVEIISCTIPKRRLVNIKLYSCMLCKTLNFQTEQDVHQHMKEKHSEIYKSYSFLKRKCRRCNGLFKSFSFLGLISHVLARKCKPKKKVQVVQDKKTDDEHGKKKKKFLDALSLCPKKPHKEQPLPLHNPVRSLFRDQKEKKRCISSNKLQQKFHSVDKFSSINSSTNRNLSLVQDKPLICTWTQHLKKFENKRSTISQPSATIEKIKSRICTSFLCKTRNNMVENICDECVKPEPRPSLEPSPFFYQYQYPQQQQHQPKIHPIISVPVPATSIPNHDRPPKYDKPTKPIHHNNNREVKVDNELYMRAITASRSSAILANLKNCSKTVKAVERLKRVKEKKKNNRRKSNEENNTEVEKPLCDEKVGIRIDKKFWNEVKLERQVLFKTVEYKSTRP